MKQSGGYTQVPTAFDPLHIGTFVLNRREESYGDFSTTRTGPGITCKGMEKQTWLSVDDLTKHWLLNLAVEIPVDLHRILPAIHAEGLNVHPIAGCEASDYARGIIRLFDEGMIELSSQLPTDDVKSSVGVLQIIDRFVRLSKDDPRIVPLYSYPDVRPNRPVRPPELKVTYRLTQLGGAEWERVAKPDWANFVTGSDDYESGEVMSADKDRLLAYMGWYPEINGAVIQLDTITWETHADFNILYWKRLPCVYRVSFQLQVAKERWSSGSGPRWFWDWYFSTTHWFTEPWELPDWPSH